MIIYRPSQSRIDNYVGLLHIKGGIPVPTDTKEEWDKNHKAFVLRVLMPSIRPPEYVWRITAEAYLTKVYLEETNQLVSFEQALSDGSTLVPNIAYRWGNIKDPWGVAHDLVYILHKLKLTDMHGHKWKLLESHNMYRDGWYASKMYVIGSIWWVGLVSGGWVLWNRPLKKTFEPVTDIIYQN